VAIDVRWVVTWVARAAGVGVLAGLAGAFFLVTLDLATEARLDHPWLLWLLPVAGLATGLAYHHLGGEAARGTNLILDEIHRPTSWVPRRMGPLVYVGTIVTHLCGGSAGREGTAIQLSGSLTDAVARFARVAPGERRLLLVVAIAGGFGAVFGVPLAGTVFALEVQDIGGLRGRALVPALVAAAVGDLVVRALGVGHTPTPTLQAADLSAAVIGQAAVMGVAAGLVALVFVLGTHHARALAARVPWAPARPVLGGVAVLGLTAAVGSRDYLGLSLPLATEAFVDVGAVALGAFALKGLFTAVTIGSGFQGGEVTPLLVIGATLGAAVAQVLGVDGAVLPAVGYVAVLAGAANAPAACTVMGVELFGWAALPVVVVGCVLAYLVSGHRSIYSAQRHRHPVRHVRRLVGGPDAVTGDEVD
jgi:H+/Cl- antiporter ClcA